MSALLSTRKVMAMIRSASNNPMADFIRIHFNQIVL